MKIVIRILKVVIGIMLTIMFAVMGLYAILIGDLSLTWLTWVIVIGGTVMSVKTIISGVKG